MKGRKSHKDRVKFDLIKEKVAEGLGIQEALDILKIHRGSYWKYTTKEQREELKILKGGRKPITDTKQKLSNEFIYNAF